MVPELLKGIGGTNKRKIGDPPSLRKQGFSIVIVLVIVGVLVVVVVVDVALDFLRCGQRANDHDEHDWGGLRYGAG